jgi:sigma-B regulation protein RsbU (phosphoserine phosphatase)
VIGLIENVHYQQGSVRISPGDLLVAFTDGISEAMNLEDEEWGEDRLLDSIRGCPAKTAQDLLEYVFAAATHFAGAAPQHDDMTLVVLRAFAPQS